MKINTFRSNFVALFAISMMILAANSLVFGQKIVPKYKVGDRVEVDVIEASDPSRSIWKKGTITTVDTVSLVAYIVEVDPVRGQLPKLITVPIRPYAEGWLRPLGGAAPKTQSDKLKTDDDGTVLADRELLDCEHIKQPKARNGSPLPVELAKKLIRCLYEKPSVAGSDGATIMDIVEFSPTAARRWNKNVDMGSAATAGTMVYPVRVKWNQKTFYRSYNETQTGSERIFTCFVDGDQWFCGSAQFIKDGEKQQIKVIK